MTKNIIAILLLLVSAGLSLKHGWDAFQPTTPDQVKIMTELGIEQSFMPYFGVFSIIIGLMLFFPKTYFISNILHAFTIVLIMALSLNAVNYKMALIEIPFLAMPLILIWLKYPFKS
ncbi:hypothetical protein [Flavobacterium eburneipallidum]|uniref:hypothetical protein n=1 Tax=Flavobacterium eburneipallidum TaxID=3003263 RepID=UPI0022AC21E8|nr:hypothetical protein [Flavobacterium eburneipallidum]